MLLADHYARSDVPERAARWYLAAAGDALVGHDFAAVLDRVERGVSCCREPTVLAELRRVEAEAHRWSGDLGHARAAIGHAIALLPPGSAAWFRAVGIAGTIASLRDDLGSTLEVAAILREAVPGDDAVAEYVVACSAIAARLLLHGRLAAGVELIDCIRRVSSQTLPAVARAWIARAEAFLAAAEDDIGGYLSLLERSIALYDEAGDARYGAVQRLNAAEVYRLLGDFERARALVAEVVAVVGRFGLVVPASQAAILQAEDHLDRDDPVRALEILDAPRVDWRGARLYGTSRIVKAEALLQLGDLASAELLLRESVTLLDVAPPLCARAMARLSRVILLAGGDPAEALSWAQRAVAHLQNGHAVEVWAESVLLPLARALEACGRGADAAAAAQQARAAVLTRASRIRDPALRETYLRCGPGVRAVLDTAERLSHSLG